MAGIQPVAVYAMKVPAGDVMVPAVPDFAAMFQLSMAAIDPTAEPDFEDGDKKKVARSTLKLIRVPNELFNDESDDSDYDDIESDEDEDEESSDEEEVNGGPSDPSKARKSNKLDLVKAIAEQDSDFDSEDEEEDDAKEEATAKAALMKILKGKGKVVGDADKDGDEDDDDDEDSLELEEVVICTLDPEKVCLH
jgi:FK506-binding nuclear protein